VKYKILITGSSGFLARHLYESLQRHDLVEEVLGIDEKQNFACVWSKQADISNAEALQGNLAGFSPDIVFHLSSPPPTASLETLIGTNLVGTRYLLNVLAKQRKRPRVLVIGSAAEYGYVRPDEIPVKEGNALRPLSYYGLSKAAQTMLCLAEMRGLDIPVIICRPFNIIGPGMPDFLAFGSFARQIASAEKLGEECSLRAGNLEGKRDFIDVRDVAEALCLLAKKGRAGEVYNICTGESHSIGEGLKLLMSHSRIKMKIVQEKSSYRPFEPPDFVGDPSKIEQQTGWRMTIAFEQSLQDLLHP
jgi:GDP-4-dehydro-6-deoxy-D-mannose reductase